METNNFADIEDLFKAIYEKDKVKIKALLKKNFFKENDDHLIITACHSGDSEIVKLLLHYGFEIKHVKSFHIYIFISKCYFDIIKLLLEYTSDYYFKKMIFKEALLNYSIEIIEYCLKRSLIDQKEIICSLGIFDYSMPKSIPIIKLLIDSGADVHCNNETAFIMSCYYGYLDIVKILLNNNVNVYAENNKAFVLACTAGRLEIVKLLLEYGININSVKNKILREISNYFIKSYIEKKNEYLTIIKILFDCGADPDSESGIILLRDSCLHGFIDIVNIYLCYQVNPNNIFMLNQSDRNSFSVLHATCYYGHIDILKLLIEYGFDIESIDSKGRNILTYASKKGKNDIVQWLSKF